MSVCIHMYFMMAFHEVSYLKVQYIHSGKPGLILCTKAFIKALIKVQYLKSGKPVKIQVCGNVYILCTAAFIKASQVDIFQNWPQVQINSFLFEKVWLKVALFPYSNL